VRDALAVALALVSVLLTVAALHLLFESQELRPKELSAWVM
jgi:hypothetical protein